MITRIEIDLNVRIRGNGSFAGFEDVRGPISVGQEIEVYEQESAVFGRGRVTEIDSERELVYLSVDWGSLAPQPAPSHAGSSVHGRYLIGLTGVGKVAVCGGLMAFWQNDLYVGAQTFPVFEYEVATDPKPCLYVMDDSGAREARSVQWATAVHYDGANALVSRPQYSVSQQ